MSDHADWPGLLRAIKATGAMRVIVTHGQEAVMVRWLQENGWQAGSFETAFGGEGEGGNDAPGHVEDPAGPSAGRANSTTPDATA